MEQFLEVIQDCAQKVYSALGGGFSESVYHRAMEVEFRYRGIQYETKVIIPIMYRGLTVGHGEADLIVYDEKATMMGDINVGIVIELKAVAHEPRTQEREQLEGYIKCRGWIDACGLLINFRQPFNTTIDFIVFQKKNE